MTQVFKLRVWLSAWTDSVRGVYKASQDSRGIDPFQRRPLVGIRRTFVFLVLVHKAPATLGDQSIPTHRPRQVHVFQRLASEKGRENLKNFSHTCIVLKAAISNKNKFLA